LNGTCAGKTAAHWLHFFVAALSAGGDGVRAGDGAAGAGAGAGAEALRSLRACHCWRPTARHARHVRRVSDKGIVFLQDEQSLRSAARPGPPGAGELPPRTEDEGSGSGLEDSWCERSRSICRRREKRVVTIHSGREVLTAARGAIGIEMAGERATDGAVEEEGIRMFLIADGLRRVVMCCRWV
jgi:hypothetical protein